MVPEPDQVVQPSRGPMNWNPQLCGAAPDGHHGTTLQAASIDKHG